MELSKILVPAAVRVVGQFTSKKRLFQELAEITGQVHGIPSAQVLDGLQRFHAHSGDEPGVNAARLRRMALPGLQQGAHDALWRGLLDALLQDGSMAQSGAWLHLPGHSVQLSQAEESLAQQLLPALQEGHFDPPWVRDLARSAQAGEEPVRQLLRKLARQGLVFQPVKDLFYAAPAMDALAAGAVQLPAPAQALMAAAAKVMTSTAHYL